jgi:hypothetical protein
MHDEQMAVSKSFCHSIEQPKSHLNESGLSITDRWRLENLLFVFFNNPNAVGIEFML